MKLKQKEFTKADGTVIKLIPEWISTKLGEVYELSHIDKIDQERLHYGYVSKGKYAPSIEVIGFKIKPVEDVLNKRFVYPLFEIGGGDFKALESVVSLPSMLMNKDDSSLFEIRSLKGDIILTNSEINMLQSNEGKSSSLEAKEIVKNSVKQKDSFKEFESL